MMLRVRRPLSIALVAGVAVICARTSFAAPVPAIEQQRLVAEFGVTYVPSFVPPGYVYVRWEPLSGSADAYGEWPQILFGKHGRLVQWTVENAQDPQMAQTYEYCVKHSYFGSKVFHLNGKTVYYAGGAVGQDAFVCLPKYHGLVVWNDYSLSPATLVRVAASAHPVG
jgi:hypothetical protein